MIINNQDYCISQTKAFLTVHYLLLYWLIAIRNFLLNFAVQVIYLF